MQSKQLSTGRTTRRGYSLIEMLVAMAVMTILMIAVLSLFDSSARLARTQTELSNVQQSLRVANHEVSRVLRMAGAGGLPLSWGQVPGVAGGIQPSAATPALTYDTFGAFPKGFGISLDNNVGAVEIPADTTTSATSDSDLTVKHYVLPGSDILTVRGVFSTPVYYLTPTANVEQDLINTDDELEGMIRLPNRVNDVVSRPLGPFLQRVQDAIDEGEQLAFIGRDLTNPDAYVVMRLNPGTTYLTPQSCNCQLSAAGVCTNSFDHGVTYTDFREAKCVTIGVDIPTSGDQDVLKAGVAFGNLSLGTKLLANAGTVTVNLPEDSERDTVSVPKQLGSLGILEEYRFYVRAEYQIPGDSSSGLAPILTRAEFVPGTDMLVDRIDLVENIIDMQVAFAIDTDRDRSSDGYGLILDNGTAEDEILYNALGEDPTSGDPDILTNKFADVPKWYHPGLRYHYLRLTTVAQTTKPDLNHRAAPLGVIEDSDRGGTLAINGNNFNLNSKLNYRRRYLTTIVDMRNLK